MAMAYRSADTVFDEMAWRASGRTPATLVAPHPRSAPTGAIMRTISEREALKTIRIAIADDHAVVREGLQRIIARADDLAVAVDVASGDELLTALRSTPVDVVVLDLALGARSGLDLLKHIGSEFPRLPVLILSMHPSEDFALRSLRAGAAGYVQKETASEELLAAIRRVAGGRAYVSPDIAGRLAVDAARGGEKRPHERLSDRELEVFQLIGAGKSVSEIAGVLNLSVKTVSTHRARILRKTGLSGNAAIIRYALANHLA